MSIERLTIHPSTEMFVDRFLDPITEDGSGVIQSIDVDNLLKFYNSFFSQGNRVTMSDVRNYVLLVSQDKDFRVTI